MSGKSLMLEMYKKARAFHRNPRSHAFLSATLLVATVLCAAVLAFLIFSAALDKNTAMWGKAVLFIIGILAALATLLVSRSGPQTNQAGDSAKPDRLLHPPATALVMLAVFAAFGTMTDALSLFAPRAVVESEPGVIQRSVEETSRRVGQLVAESEFDANRLSGVWGETPDCDVSYRISIKDEMIEIEWENPPPNATEWAFLGQIIVAQEQSVRVATERPVLARGELVTFEYAELGSTARLTWSDASTSVPLKLDRCVG